MKEESKGKKRPNRRADPQRIFRLVANKARASTQPVATLNQLTGLWDRDFAVYTPLVVQVTARKGSRLSFKVVIDDQGATGTEVYTVDLDDGVSAWGDLPSTAQLVKPGTLEDLGYLLLTQNWIYQNLDDSDLALFAAVVRGPPKIPKHESL